MNAVMHPEGLPQLKRNAAGLDVGSAAHYFAVPAGRDAELVQEFGSFTPDGAMAEGLQSRDGGDAGYRRVLDGAV